MTNEDYFGRRGIQQLLKIYIWIYQKNAEWHLFKYSLQEIAIQNLFSMF